MLCKNDLEEQIAKELSNSIQDWYIVVERFKLLFGNGPFSWGSICGLLAELYVRECLDKICDQYGERIIIDPVECNRRTKHFLFKYKNSSLCVYSNIFGMMNPYSDIDELLLVDGLPVLFEIKTGSYNPRGSLSNKSPSSLGTVYALRPDRIKYVTKPIKEYFESECGYIVITPKDHIRPETKSQRDFASNNGIIVPFYATRDQFQLEDLPKIVRDFQLCVKGPFIRAEYSLVE